MPQLIRVVLLQILRGGKEGGWGLLGWGREPFLGALAGGGGGLSLQLGFRLFGLG